ncbi:hypothetical protein H5410_036372 [Solanum commersonii]|uniref:Uncharacterized protein n=1 Tax=Solanum commersonii TaxID=4109 RepID=A0A9J5Y799_SOLCO|nr:hypothetical protein H5410_036372 [Solanum commersonii]
MTNTKIVPWNYNKVLVTHKGKNIVEKTNETRGLTCSARITYTNDELALERSGQNKALHLSMKSEEYYVKRSWSIEDH